MTAALPPAKPRLRLATVWLMGCSGCHMAFLDLDEALVTLADRYDIVHSPVLSDRKVFPEGVDVCLVEGAVASVDNLAMARRLRLRSRLVVALGDCAVTGTSRPCATSTLTVSRGCCSVAGGRPSPRLTARCRRCSNGCCP